ncbi:hypothetical protein [Sinorhizobium meliloti]|uniref:hypothetical protein n=1 Tax=Rhizobium meliloti TaxID=382 RepID=UPI0013E3D3DC|nr:hypothetical protein [Sinorhizobium meliloti]
MHSFNLAGIMILLAIAIFALAWLIAAETFFGQDFGENLRVSKRLASQFYNNL